MAQWNRTERTLYAKLVYYGPALGGKTTNLRVLHAITDPDGKEKLVSVETADDRTLFFDLLPFELGSVLGYRVAVKLYTVPGQVRYDRTRKLVLAGADAVIFVADSDPAREQENRLAWDDLRRNMRANGLDPKAVPVLVQLNKRDLAGAAPAASMARWFGVDPEETRAAIACDGPGVLETFVSACRAMIERIVAMAEPATRKTLDAGDLGGQVDRAFAPLLLRAPRSRRASGEEPPLVLPGADPFEDALAAGLALGGQLADEHGRASRLAREADALRAVSDVLRSTGASFDRGVIVDAALTAAMTTLDAEGAALVSVSSGIARIQAGVGHPLDDLVATPAGGALIARMAASPRTAVADRLASELPGVREAAGLEAIAAVPVEASPSSALFVAMREPDGAIHPHDVRFLATLAAHLAVGLDKVRTYAALRRHRDLLERAVRERTAELRRAYDDLRSVDAMKDRFLSNVSHEMRSPLTAVIGAATFLRDYDGRPEQRREMADAILHAASSLKELLDGLLRVAGLEAGSEIVGEPLPPAELVAEALRLACAESRVAVTIDPAVASIAADRRLIARALANLVDNAVKFAPAGSPVELRVGTCVLVRGTPERGVAISVLDRGPGILEVEAERIFVAFEQGGDPLTAKPGGVGLGLYEARAIARRHGGTVIHLPRPGGGSEFRLSLPAESTRAADDRKVADA